MLLIQLTTLALLRPQILHLLLLTVLRHQLPGACLQASALVAIPTLVVVLPTLSPSLRVLQNLLLRTSPIQVLLLDVLSLLLHQAVLQLQ